MRALTWLLLSIGCAGSWHWQPVSSIPRPAGESADAPAVVVQDEISYRLVIPEKATAYSRVQRHAVIAILSEGGFKFAAVTIPLGENQSLRFLKARTIAPDGQVQEVNPEQIFDESARDSKHQKSSFKKFHLPGVKVGGLIEYAYELETPGVFWSLTGRISSELPVLHYHTEIVVEGRVEWAAKVYQLPVGWKEEPGEDLHLTLDAEDIPASRAESLSPPWQIAEPWWAFRLRRVHRYRNDQVIYNRWSDVVEELVETLYINNEKYLKGVSLKPGPDCGADRRCALERAVSWVREETALDRFVGSLDQARHIKEVLASGSANNFEKALLLWGRLNAAGVESYFALVGRNDGLSFDHDFPLPGQFDHLIVFVPAQAGLAEPRFVDPSCEQCAPGQLSAWIDGREALLLQGHESVVGTEARAGFLPITGAPPEISYQHRRIDAQLDAAGALTGTLVVERHGQEAVDWQIETRKWLPDRWRKHLENEVARRHKTGRLGSTSPEKCERATADCRHSAAWTLSGYAAADGDRLVVPLALLSSPWDRLAVDKERHNQVFLRSGDRDEETVTLHLPAGYVVEELPHAATLSSPALEARLEVSSQPGVVTLKRTLESRRGRWDRAQYPLVAVVLEGSLAWRRQTITLRRH